MKQSAPKVTCSQFVCHQDASTENLEVDFSCFTVWSHTWYSCHLTCCLPYLGQKCCQLAAHLDLELTHVCHRQPSSLSLVWWANLHFFDCFHESCSCHKIDWSDSRLQHRPKVLQLFYQLAFKSWTSDFHPNFACCFHCKRVSTQLWKIASDLAHQLASDTKSRKERSAYFSFLSMVAARSWSYAYGSSRYDWSMLIFVLKQAHHRKLAWYLHLQYTNVSLLPADL